MKKVVVYELDQLPALETYLKTAGPHTVFACGLDIEFALEQKKIPYESARTLRTTPTPERLVWAERMADGLFDDPAMDFFSYRDVHLGELFVVMVQDYLGRVSYWLDIATTMLARGSTSEVVVFTSTQSLSPVGREVDRFEVRAPVDAFRLVSAQHSVPCTVVPLAVAAFPTHRLRDKLVGWVFAAVHVAVSVAVRPKKMRMLASDYWRSLGPLMAELPEAELSLLDRGEMLQMGWREIVRNRVRFIHIDDYLSRSGRRAACTAADALLSAWRSAAQRNVCLRNLKCSGVSISGLLHEVLEKIMVTGALRATQAIEGAYAMMHTLEPHVVLVRASTSAQIHFAIMCHVARRLNIPSIEIQHGTLYLGPGSYATRPTAEYIAEYGPRARAELTWLGYDAAHLLDIGSPRFESYVRAVRAHPIPHSAHVAYIAPEVIPGLWVDSYDCMDYFESLAQALPAGAHVTVKLRPGPSYESFYREAITRAFRNNPHTVAQYEPLAQVFGNASVIVSGYSTAVIEALLSDRPHIYSSVLPMHRIIGESFAYPEYADRGALLVAADTASLRTQLARLLEQPEIGQRLVAGARAFMEREYCFNDGASRRLADAIRTVVTTRPSRTS